MRIVFLVPLLLTACTGGPLYPDRLDTRTCPEVVSDSYKSLSRYKRKSSLSTGFTFGVAGGSCILITGGACLIVGAVAYAADIALDPFGKGAASSEFNNNMRQGRTMKCTEN